MIGIPVGPPVFIYGFECMVQLEQIVPILAVPKIQAEGRVWKAKSLKPVVLRIQHAVAIHDHSRNPPIFLLIFHKKQLIVQRGLHVTLGIHTAAHGLRLQPDIIVSSAFHQNLPIPKIANIMFFLFFCRVVEFLQCPIRRLKCHFDFHSRPPSPLSSEKTEI